MRRIRCPSRLNGKELRRVWHEVVNLGKDWDVVVWGFMTINLDDIEE